MNILPHKSWHVRTKQNIARVRKDEAKAAEEAKEIERRVALAAQESRTSFLRERAKQRFQQDTTAEEEKEEGKTGEEAPNKVTFESASGLTQDDGHVNFFQDIEQGIKQKYETNEDHESEKKKEQEDYEKKIGYLTYLGQNSLEHSKERPWYESIARPSASEKPAAPSSTSVADASLKDSKFKDFHDPLKDIRKYLHTPGVKARMDKLAKKRPAQSDVPPPSKKVKKTKKVKKHKSKKHSKKHKRHRRSESGSSKSSEYESDGELERRRAEDLARLRAERVEREKEESKKAERLMAKLRGETLPEDEKKIDPEEVKSGRVKSSSVRQKYNSQFNPHLARQNY